MAALSKELLLAAGENNQWYEAGVVISAGAEIRLLVESGLPCLQPVVPTACDRYRPLHMITKPQNGCVQSNL